MADQNIPFGLRQVMLTEYTDAGGTTLDTEGIAYPIARTFSFSEAEDFEELRGDDKVWAVRGMGANVEWEMENGGITFGAWRAMAGGTITTTGIAPNTVTRFRKLVTDQRPYFLAEGRSINDNGGDFHAVLYRCRASEGLEGELADGAFWLSSASGLALPSLATATLDALYDFVSNETPTEIGPGGLPVGP